MELQYLKQYLHKEVVSKAKYDELIGKEIIHPEDYLFLNLSQKALKLLETMCKQYDIILEKLPPQLSSTETMSLLSYYHELKNSIKEKGQDNSKNSQIEVKRINKKIIEIRDTIFKGNLEIVYRLLTKYAKNIKNIQDREDIYQSGYEILLQAIDKYYKNSRYTFLEYLSILIYNTINKYYCISPSITFDSIERISEESELTKEQSDEFFLTSNYYGQEEHLIDLLTSKEIKKVVMTLPELEQKSIIVSYGLDGKGIRNTTDAAHELGISRESLLFNKKRALISLSLPPRRDYLKAIYLETDFFCATSTHEEIDKIMEEVDDKTLKIYMKNTKSFLIRNMPKSELAYLIREFPKDIKEILSLSYGLVDGLPYSRKKISEILGISLTQVHNKISEGMKLLISILQTSYHHKYYRYYDKDYLDFMMYEYLTGHKAKCKTKRNSH